MNLLRQTLLLLSMFFLFIDAQAAATAKPTVSSYVKNMRLKSPSESTKVVLKDALNGVDQARTNYYATVEALRQKYTSRENLRRSILAERAQVPVEQLPSCIQARQCHDHHANTVTLICQDAGLPFATFEEYYAIAAKICKSDNILLAFADGIDDNLERYESNFVQFIEFLVAVCPDSQKELKEGMRSRIVVTEQIEYEAQPSPNLFLFDYFDELASDDESTGPQVVSPEGVKQYQEAVERMLREQNDALKEREQLYQREPSAH